jgi:glutathione S-transferase
MATVEIIAFALSSYTRAVRMAWEEKGVPYELKRLLPHSPKVLAIHPFENTIPPARQAKPS